MEDEENYSTEQYATLIAESWGNGQRKQAAQQYSRALESWCEPRAVLESIEAHTDTETALAIAIYLLSQ